MWSRSFFESVLLISGEDSITAATAPVNEADGRRVVVFGVAALGYSRQPDGFEGFLRTRRRRLSSARQR